MNTPEFILQEKRSGQKGAVVWALGFHAQLLDEIAHLQGRGERDVTREQEIVLEEGFIVPDQFIIECLPIQAEENKDKEKNKNEIFLGHERRKESNSILSSGQDNSCRRVQNGFDLIAENKYIFLPCSKRKSASKTPPSL
jgi:hypothetical protein